MRGYTSKEAKRVQVLAGAGWAPAMQGRLGELALVAALPLSGANEEGTNEEGAEGSLGPYAKVARLRGGSRTLLLWARAFESSGNCGPAARGSQSSVQPRLVF